MTKKKGAEESISRARSAIGKWVAICCSIFVIYALATMELQELQLLSLFLAFSLAVGFVYYPLIPKKPGYLPLLVVDLILAGKSTGFVLLIFIGILYSNQPFHHS